MRSILAPLTAVAAWLAFAATAQATVHIDIDLSNQTMHVTSGSGANYDWAVSTGRPGHRTPTGVYRPQRMYVMVHSSKYDDAPMPHSIFFTGGYAIHGTGAVASLGQVASHGCVRLAPGNAATLFGMVEREGATIVIGGHAPGRDDVAVHETHRTEREFTASAPRQFDAGAPQPVATRAPERQDDPSTGFAPARHARLPGNWVNAPLENF